MISKARITPGGSLVRQKNKEERRYRCSSNSCTVRVSGTSGDGKDKLFESRMANLWKSIKGAQRKEKESQPALAETWPARATTTMAVPEVGLEGVILPLKGMFNGSGPLVGKSKDVAVGLNGARGSEKPKKPSFSRTAPSSGENSKKLQDPVVGEKLPAIY
ncbi:unnamed protein product [Arabis nemorensis]|uniref:Uncharacterized protein n=1 Tax=Arabis nemorensis TaxID=586526 RepID=A0A565APH2_9BRAS|nr:unnamed protein product [Arabis nemorensis]